MPPATVPSAAINSCRSLDFGGLATFGLLGLFLGPVIMAALLTVWREWVMPREPPSDEP